MRKTVYTLASRMARKLGFKHYQYLLKGSKESMALSVSLKSFY